MAAIVITGFASIDGIKEAMDLGALDYIPKPFTAAKLLESVSTVISRQRLKRHSSGKSLVVKSKAMEQVMGLVDKVSLTDCTVLLSGESGTGKEIIARALHRMSSRATGPFVSVNSGGIPEGLLESELFGHTKGSYTGASSTTIGHFQAADGGTLFMDEIGNMGSPMQIKLLRALQEREVTPVGSTKPVAINTRLISATNSDLRKDVKTGSFRQDLYYRLNVFEIHIPPLRERTDDIIPLAEHFLERLTGPFTDRTLTNGAVQALLSYSWPGNVRELENVMERAVVLAGNSEIAEKHLPEWISGWIGKTGIPAAPESFNLDQIVASIERHYIQKVLDMCGGIRSRAANMLGLKRTTLLARMKKYGIGEGQKGTTGGEFSSQDTGN
jgi:DNA-binding NtrC family response regulator